LQQLNTALFTCFLSVNSPAPELTARVRFRGKVKVRDGVRVEVKLGSRLGLKLGLALVLTKIIRVNNDAGELG